MGWKDQVAAAPPAPAAASGGWQDQSVPAVTPEHDSTEVDKLVSSSPKMKDAKNPYEAFLAGLQTSAAVIPFKQPDLQLPKNASFFQKLSATLGQSIGDIPANVAGFFGGGIAGGVAGAAVPGAGETGVSEAVGAAAGAGAGTTATPQAVREVMMNHYAHMNDKAPMTSSDFLHMVAASAWRITKAGAVGLVGGVAGKGAAVGAEAAGGGAFSQSAANLAGFTAGATSAQAAIDHKLPDAQDFAISTIAGLTLAGAGHIAASGKFVPNAAGERVMQNQRQIYRETGINPWEQTNMAKGNPKLTDELVSHDVNGDAVIPKFNQERPPEPEADFISPKPSPLVVARTMPDGTVQYGKPGDIHANLLSDEEFDAIDKEGGFVSSGSAGTDLLFPKHGQMGFAEPGGPFMDRHQAAAFRGVTNREGGLESMHNEQLQAQAAAPKTTDQKIADHVEQLLPQIRTLENSGDRAVSPKGAIGRYQVMPGTARQYGFDPEKLSDPKYNEQVARHVLADLSRRFNGDTEAVLVAYNAGPGRAMKFVRDGRDTTELPFETQKYLAHAGFGGKGGEPPTPPVPPKEPPAAEPPEGQDPHEVPPKQEPDYSKLTDEMMVSRFQDAIGEQPSTPAKGGNIMRQWFSELESAKAIDRKITNAGLQDPKTDITFEDMVRQTYASDDRTNYMMMKGNIDPVTFDAKDGPSLVDVLGRVKDAGGNMDEFDAYRVAVRTLDLAKRGPNAAAVKAAEKDYEDALEMERDAIRGNRITSLGKDEENKTLADFRKESEAARKALEKARETFNIRGGIDTGVFKGGVAEAANLVQRPNFQKYEQINGAMQYWKRGGLEYGRDSGLFSQDSVDAMEAASSHVSLRRIRGDDDAFKTSLGGPGGLKVSNPLKAMEGSNRQIVKPLLADIDNMRQIVRMSDRNRAMGHLLGGQDALTGEQRDTLEQLGFKQLAAPEVKAMLAEPGSKVFKPYEMTPEQEKAVQPFAIESNKNANSGKRIVYYRAGVPEVWEAADPDVAALLRGAESQGDATTVSVLGHVLNLDKIMQGPAKLERAGIMGNLDTALTVPGKHQLTAWALDPLHPPPYVTMVKGLHDALTQGDTYWDLMKRGGLSGAITDMDMAKAVDKAVGDQDILQQTGALEKTWNTVSHPLHFAQLITEKLTEAEKIGYFNRAVAGGLDPNKAAMMSRTAYLDFAEKGTSVVAQRMAKMIPFFRATLLGVKYVKDGVVNDPKGSALRVTLGLVGAQMALYALNRGADQYLDPKDRYTSLPQWERDMYYITPPIGGARLKLGRPYVIGPMMGVPLERMMEAQFEKNPHAFDNFLSSWLDEMVPNPIPASVRPIMEQVTNHNFFTGKPLVSDSLKEATADQQYTDNTSEAAKKISSLLGAHRGLGIAEVSPIVLDNYVQAWTGTVGMTVLHALNTPLGKDDNNLSDWKDNIFVKGFVVQNPKMNTQQLDDFYQDAAKFSALHRDVSLEARRGDLEQAQLDKTDVGRKAALSIKIEHALTVQRTALHALNGRDDMSKDEKRQLSERIYNDAWALARFGSRTLRGQEVTEQEAGAISQSAEQNVEAAVGKQ